MVINPKNREELRFVSDLLKKLQISSHVLTEDEVEDLGMSILMGEVDRTKKVSRDTIIRKLKT